MTVKLTPEVASAHKNLRDLCERFENSVDELCASSIQSISPHEFYECECVPIAVKCVDALSKFQEAFSYETIVYEVEVAAADDALRQQKCKLEENAAQRAEAYENTVAEADEVLYQQKREFKENAAERIKAYKRAVAEADNALHQEKRGLVKDASRRITDIEHEVRQTGLITLTFTSSREKTTIVRNQANTSYNQALGRANRINKSPLSVRRWTKIGWFPLGLIYFFIAVFFRDVGSEWGGAEWGGLVFLLEIILFSILVPSIGVIVHNFWKRSSIAKVSQDLKSAALAECDVIWEDMEKAVARASAERDRKMQAAQERQEKRVKRAEEAEAVWISSAEEDKRAKIKAAQKRKEREDKQAVEAEMKTLATRDKKVEEADSKRNQVIAYIQQEYEAFDVRLCRCLDKFQALIGTWKAKNAHVTTILHNNRIQNLNENDERIGSYLTRIGTVNIWNLS